MIVKASSPASPFSVSAPEPVELIVNVSFPSPALMIVELPLSVIVSAPPCVLIVRLSVVL